MSQELTVQGSQEISLATMQGFGYEDVQLKPTKLDIVQRNSDAVSTSKPGTILDVLMDREYESVEVVPIQLFKGRIDYGKPEGSVVLGGAPICFSFDGVKPSRFAADPQAEFCSRCSQSRDVRANWAKWAQTRKREDMPPCKPNWRYYLIIRDSHLPRYLRITTAGTDAAEVLVARIKTLSLEARTKLGRLRNSWEYSFTIKTEFVEKKGSKFYVPVFKDLKPLDNPEEFLPDVAGFLQYLQAASQIPPEEDEVGEAISESTVEVQL